MELMITWSTRERASQYSPATADYAWAYKVEHLSKVHKRTKITQYHYYHWIGYGKFLVVLWTVSYWLNGRQISNCRHGANNPILQTAERGTRSQANCSPCCCQSDHISNRSMFLSRVLNTKRTHKWKFSFSRGWMLSLIEGRIYRTYGKPKPG